VVVETTKAGENVIRLLRFADNKTIDHATLDFFPIPIGMSVSADEYALLSRPDTSGTDLFLVTNSGKQ
jgi:hypothetical protein